MATSAKTTEQTPGSLNITFAALPYVEVIYPFELGAWRLWPNTKEDWLRETGRDLTSFMKMYRGRYFGRGSQPAAVDRRASVLTRKGGTSPTAREFHEAIHALSTLGWLTDMPSAESWLFEVWQLPPDYPKEKFYVRRSKFHSNITSHDFERVYASAYTYPSTFRPYSDELNTFIADTLNGAATGALRRSLGQFHTIRFDTPYYSSYGNDLESLWSGFEAWFLPTRTADKASALSSAIWAELSAYGCVDSRLENGISTFLQRLYDARNDHSHAALEPDDKNSFVLGRPLLGLGLALASSLLKLRAFKGNDFVVQSTADDLVGAFLRRDRTREWLALATTIESPEDWYDSLKRSGTPQQFADIESTLTDIVKFKGFDGFEDDPAVRKTCATMGRVLFRWIDDVANSGNSAIRAIAHFPNKGQELFRELKIKHRGTKLTEELNKHCIAVALGCVDEWSQWSGFDRTDSIRLGGTVPIRTWLSAWVRMQELFVGDKLESY